MRPGALVDRVVDQRVDATPFAEHGVDHGVDRRTVEEVHRHRERALARGLDGGRRRRRGCPRSTRVSCVFAHGAGRHAAVALVHRARRDGDVVACVGERERGGTPDAAARTGDESDGSGHERGHYRRQHEPLVLVDDPAPRVRRLTLNRPEKRNAISNALRTELYDALHAADRDPDVGVTIIRGAGPCFSSGYDLKSSLSEDRPFYTPRRRRHVVAPRRRRLVALWDLAKPVIAQVHGYAMAGGTELMAACDLVYIAEDAQLSYPVVRVLSPPDFQFHPWLVGMRAAMELMLTGDAIDGREAVRIGMANRAFPEADLERETLAMAARVASIPSDLLQINKRTVHRAMEFKGVRTATRAGSELQGLASNLETSKQFFGATCRPRSSRQPSRTERERRYFRNATGAVVLVLLAPGLDAVDVPAHEVVPADQVLVAEVHEAADASRPRRGTRGRARRCPPPARASRCRWRGRARGWRAGPWRRVTPRRRAGGSP